MSNYIAYVEENFLKKKASNLFSALIEGRALSEKGEMTIDELIKKKYPEIAKQKGD